MEAAAQAILRRLVRPHERRREGQLHLLRSSCRIDFGPLPRLHRATIPADPDPVQVPGLRWRGKGGESDRHRNMDGVRHLPRLRGHLRRLVASRMNLRAYRIARDLTQHDLALLAGVSLETVGEVERGRRPRHDTQRRLLEALRIPWGRRGEVFEG